MNGPFHDLSIHNAEPCLDACEQLLAEGKVSELPTVLDGLMALDLGCDTSLRCGDLCRALGDLPRAEQFYRNVIKKDGSMVAAFLKLGEILPLEEAATHYRQMVLLHQGPEGFTQLGYVYCEMGDLAKAEACYLEALQAKPDFADALLNLAVIYQESDRLELAEQTNRYLLEAQPNLVEGWLNLGVIQTENADYHEAKETFQKVIHMNDSVLEAYNNLGFTHFLLGEYEQAVSVAVAGLQKGDDPMFHDLLGKVYFEQRAYEQALVEYLKLLEAVPDYADAHYSKGLCLQSLKRLSEASNAYEEACRLNPELKEARFLADALKGIMPDHAPNEYIRVLFDSFAADFEEDLIQFLSYEAPEKMFRVLTEVLGDQKFRIMADLGCGTGLAGAVFASIVDTLDGFDLSQKMLDLAEEKEVYRKLYQGDLVALLPEHPQQYDLVVAADVFIYLGQLQPVFSAVAKGMVTGGILVFSTESSDTKEIILRASCRYSYHPSYVVKLLNDAGFELLKRERLKLRKDHDRWIMGDIYLARFVG